MSSEIQVPHGWWSSDTAVTVEQCDAFRAVVASGVVPHGALTYQHLGVIWTWRPAVGPYVQPPSEAAWQRPFGQAEFKNHAAAGHALQQVVEAEVGFLVRQILQGGIRREVEQMVDTRHVVLGDIATTLKEITATLERIVDKEMG